MQNQSSSILSQLPLRTKILAVLMTIVIIFGLGGIVVYLLDHAKTAMQESEKNRAEVRAKERSAYREIVVKQREAVTTASVFVGPKECFHTVDAGPQFIVMGSFARVMGPFIYDDEKKIVYRCE